MEETLIDNKQPPIVNNVSHLALYTKLIYYIKINFYDMDLLGLPFLPSDGMIVSSLHDFLFHYSRI
jgi:hypothetical protein